MHTSFARACVYTYKRLQSVPTDAIIASAKASVSLDAAAAAVFTHTISGSVVLVHVHSLDQPSSCMSRTKELSCRKKFVRNKETGKEQYLPGDGSAFCTPITARKQSRLMSVTRLCASPMHHFAFLFLFCKGQGWQKLTEMLHVGFAQVECYLVCHQFLRLRATLHQLGN
jgi:hypothetical protein